MKTFATSFSALLCAVVLALLPCVVSAHPITVDGSIDEWSTRSPEAANLGLVARNSSAQGELIWLDATGDARTDMVHELQADIISMALTADTTICTCAWKRQPHGQAHRSPCNYKSRWTLIDNRAVAPASWRGCGYRCV